MFYHKFAHNSIETGHICITKLLLLSLIQFPNMADRVTVIRFLVTIFEGVVVTVFLDAGKLDETPYVDTFPANIYVFRFETKRA